MTRNRLALALALALLTSCSVASAVPSYGATYTRKVLFRVNYGTGKDQIGATVAWGFAASAPADRPVGLQIDGAGRIYIADYVNECVKIFDSNGYYSGRTEGNLPELMRIAVDTRGNIYAVYDFEHLSKFSSVGARLWTVTSQEVLPERMNDGFENVYPAPEGQVVVAGGTTIQPLVLLSSKGKVERPLKGYFCSESGVLYEITSPTDYRYLQKSMLKLQTWRLSDGRNLGGMLLNENPRMNPLYEGKGDDGIGQPIFNHAGNLYMVAQVQSVHPRQVGRWHFDMDLVVERCDARGKVIQAVRIPGGPFDESQILAVDNSGAVYHLEFTPRYVEVVRYRPVR